MARILVVDDEPKLGKVVCEALALDGHAVTRADGGRAALAELQKDVFEIVVSAALGASRNRLFAGLKALDKA